MEILPRFLANCLQIYDALLPLHRIQTVRHPSIPSASQQSIHMENTLVFSKFTPAFSQLISLIFLVVLSLAGLSVIGGLSVLTFTKSFGTIFLGQPRTSFNKNPEEVSNLMLVPQYLIVAVMISISLVPQFYMKIIGNLLILISPINCDFGVMKGVIETTAHISWYSLVLVGCVALLWLVRSLALKRRPVHQGKTWGCGYVAPDSRQQYTGKSFSKPLGKIFNVLIIEKKEFHELEKGEIFPDRKSYVSHYQDFFEHRIIKPPTDWLIYASRYFSFIQNGRIQSYVLYGIVFILAMFLLTVFNFVA